MKDMNLRRCQNVGSGSYAHDAVYSLYLLRVADADVRPVPRATERLRLEPAAALAEPLPLRLAGRR